MRIVFFGSSNFSLRGLHACLESSGGQIAGVITTPPQRQGRGLVLVPSIVAQFCIDQKIEYCEFNKLDDQALAQVSNWKPDVFVVSSYGKIIPECFLGLAKFRFNIHPSLLPKYRGASPLNGPILAGDSKTGLSIADVTKDLDAGDIYYQEELFLSPSDDAEKINRVLSDKSYFVMREILEKARVENLTLTPQDHAQASYAPKLTKEDGHLFFSDPAIKWDRSVRGLAPWPGAFTEVHHERVGLIAVKTKASDQDIRRGTILDITQESLWVQAVNGAVEWLQVKPAGKKGMSGGDYARGRRWRIGMNLQ